MFNFKSGVREEVLVVAHDLAIFDGWNESCFDVGLWHELCCVA